MITIDREKLVYTLEGVIPGTEEREVIEQSTCFVFRKGYVYTYNEDISCKSPLPIKETSELDSVVVKAKAMLDLLRTMTQDTIDLAVDDNTLHIYGKKGNESAGLRIERDIALPIDNVEVPTEWIKLNQNFIDGVALVQECAGKDSSKFNQTCVHIHPEWVEACDGLQMARYNLNTKVKTPILIRQANIRHIITAKGMPRMLRFAVTSKWIHFTNDDGLVMSIRYHKDEYPDMSRHLEVSGKKVSFPKELHTTLTKAMVFSQENANNKLVRVDLKGTPKLNFKIRSEGPSGWYEKKRTLAYSGPSIAFMISPKLLESISKRYEECEVSESRLIVKGEDWRYVACLGKVEESSSEDSPKKTKKQDAPDTPKKAKKKGKKVKV